MPATSSDNYQLIENELVAGYERESVNGQDPAGLNGGRLDWIGQVLNINLTEDYGHQDFQPLGSGPDPHFVLKKNESFELEVESFASIPFSQILENEMLTMSLGVPEVTLTHTVPSGGDGQYAVGEILTQAVSGAVGVVIAAPSPTSSTVRMATVTSFDTTNLVTGSGEAETSTPSTVDATGSINLRRPQCAYTVEYGTDDPVNPRFHTLSGCKTNSASFVFRPDDLILVRLSIMGRVHSVNSTVVDCAANGGTDLNLLPPTQNVPAHFSHTTFTLLDVPGGTPIVPIITELDLTITNNVTPQWSDNGEFFPSHLIEGKRRITFNMRVKKTSEAIGDIIRALPSTDAGKLDFLLVVSQPGGWYMSFDMPRCTLTELTEDRNEEVQEGIESSFAGLVVGTPTIDMEA